MTVAAQADPARLTGAVAVGTVDVATLRLALGGAPGEDLIDLLVRDGAAIMQEGEQQWSRSLGMDPELRPRVGA